MILGGVDVYLTNITTVYLPVYGLPILISLIVFVLTMSLFKMWIVDLERRKVRIVDREVRRSNRIRSNRKRSQLVQSTTTSRNFEAELVQSTTTSIDFEAELDKPYGKALKEIYSDEQIKRAIIYMNQKGTFSNQMKTSTIVGKNIQHIEDVDEWARTFSIDTDPETNFPKELPKPDLVNRLLQFKEWDHAEINLVLDETFKAYRFYPTPREFCEIYERKKGKLDMLEKNQSRLREENDKLIQEIVFLKQKCISQDELEKMIGELQKQNSYLQKRQSCKICSENELEIMLIPCRHVYCCKECFNKQRRKWCNICNQTVQRVDSFHLP